MVPPFDGTRRPFSCGPLTSKMREMTTWSQPVLHGHILLYFCWQQLELGVREPYARTNLKFRSQIGICKRISQPASDYSGGQILPNCEEKDREEETKSSLDLAASAELNLLQVQISAGKLTFTMTKYFGDGMRAGDNL